MNGMPDRMSNGSEHVGNDAQVWERPWTLEEMRHNSADWSLAADSGLLLFLQDFSQRMLSKTHEIEKQLDSLIRDTKATDSRLNSVFNDFLMLSNTQFIENRVYDEEVEEPMPKTDAVEKQPDQKTREQKEAELIPKMQEAVTYGLKVLECAFEHLDIKAGNSDSEDEEANDRVEAILEPKDLYVDRPLPCLIGSQAFMEQEDVGLGDLSSDELSVDSERDSVIDSEDGKDADNSDEDFMQEEEDVHHSMKKKSSMLSYEDDEDDSDIFGDSDKEEEDAKVRLFTPCLHTAAITLKSTEKLQCLVLNESAGPSSFADELAARIKGELVGKPTGDRASLSSRKKSKSRKEAKPVNLDAPAEDDSDDMFKPPKMDYDDDDDDDDFSPFGGKSGLFSGGKGLFDDDDEGDLFSDALKLPVSKPDKSPNESIKSATRAAEPDKTVKKVLPGAISKFPDNSLFGPVDDLMESRENGAPTNKTHVTPKPAPVLGGLFDEEDDGDDDFFSGKSLKNSSTAAQEKSKPQKVLDLFDEDDEDGDIFSEKAAQSKMVEEPVKLPEKKMPAGAISMFGPVTQNVLSEGLKKRQPSPSEESEKAEKNGLVPESGTTVTRTQKHMASSLFSDDEDTQIFPTIPRSQSNPHTTSQSRINKHHVSLFDDDEEEDLFGSKPKPSAAKTPQPSSLFSDDEGQWISPKATVAKQENKTGGMKPSASAPSSLPGGTTLHKSSLFDEDEDDLFAPAKESSQKKPQRGSLLFEDEHDEDKGSLFGIKTDDGANAAVKPNSLLDKSPESADAKKIVKEKPSVPQKPVVKPPETLPPSSETTECKKKPVGAVNLFGGIDVLAQKQAKTVSDEDDDSDYNGPPPNVKTQTKVKRNALSLFDDDKEEDEEDPIFTPSKPTARNTAKPVEQRPQSKSTGVFLDEELLFSPTQQKDNDPDVDLFAAPEKTTSAKLSSVKPAMPSFFSEAEEDDLFGPSKPPKVAEKPRTSQDIAPLVSPESISDIQASLKINPAAFLPGSTPTMPGAISVLPGLDPSSSSGVSSSSMSPSPATTPIGSRTDSEAGVSFDTPLQVSMLQNANKGRIRGSVHRRPQSRAARQASQRSAAEQEDFAAAKPSVAPSSSSSSVLPPPGHSSQPRLPDNATPITSSPLTAQPPPAQISTKPSSPTLPVSNHAKKQYSSKDRNQSEVLPPFEEDDIFASDSLFGSVTNIPPAKKVEHQAGAVAKKDVSNLPSIFDDDSDDLFQTVKPKSAAKTAKVAPFLEDDDDDDDIFGLKSSSTSTSTSSRDVKSRNIFTKQDILEDDVVVLPESHKKDKDKSTDVSLFDDKIDIFADLTDSFTPNQKTKAKVASRSIFDDDMDDIFAPSTVKTATKATPKAKTTPPSKETNTAVDSCTIFDDPLNALGRN
ncbi:WASH complex subunit 2 isoform X2 [Phyllopteryx taeniolatus]|uniref:WASH complex subunit 2 isoform X2 n=1 Tax=Phyllopteryx taeniolatus TaxID=161469 RepID=UPI002AD3666F|nr:WASH complex subunit 2 isoform X2 [Phyllopteryx taeniolatus]